MALKWWSIAGAVVLLGACSTTGAPADGAGTASAALGPSPTVQSTTAEVSVQVNETVATGLDAPWSVAWLPDGSALLTERDTAQIKRLVPSDGSWTVTGAGSVAGVNPDGEGGLLGLAVRPLSEDGSQVDVYAYWSTATDNRIGVMRWDGQTLTQPEVILSGIPHASFHNGGRMVFGPDDALYVATGDAGDPELAQDPNSLAGKVLRLAPDGSPAQDNPTPGSPVFSTGHRNIQGLAFDEQGRLWASEFGSQDVDELNLITAGGNYGWPLYEGAAGDPRYIDPQAQWQPTSIASPSGLAIAEGSAWVAGLRGQTLWQVPLGPSGVTGQPVAWLEGQYGRLRDVVLAPDGSLWLITNNTDGRGEPGPEDDRILRVVVSPANR